MLDACIQNFFQISTLYRVGGGRSARTFRKGCTVLRGNREMTEKYEYRSTVSRTFVQDCGYMKQEKSDLTRAHWRATPTRASAFKCPVIFNFEIYFQDFQMKKIGCDKCLQRENLHLRHLSFLGNFGQRYLWIDKSKGGLSCWPPRLIFSLCQQLLNYRKIEDDFAFTVSVIYFVLNSWSTK